MLPNATHGIADTGEYMRWAPQAKYSPPRPLAGNVPTSSRYSVNQHEPECSEVLARFRCMHGTTSSKAGGVPRNKGTRLEDEHLLLHAP